MGVGQRIREWWNGPPAVAPAPAAEPRRVHMSAVYPVDQLVLWAENRIGRVDRAKALSVPAVLRGRNMICSISTLPLQAVDIDNRVVDHPLIRQVDANVENVTTLAMTVEDLLFESVAWWRVTARGWNKYPTSAVRYAPDQVSMTPPKDYRQGYLPSGLPTQPADDLAEHPGQFIWMGGEPVGWADVIRFSSPNPGLLEAGQRAIRRAIALDDAADLYARNNRMRGYFSPKEGVDPDHGLNENGDPLTESEADDAISKMLDEFAEARAQRLDGYVPAALDYTPVSDPTPVEIQLIAQQQRADLAIANALGIDPEDLGINTTSRTYQNATDRRRDRINDVLAPYMTVVTQRLTMPDVTKRGTSVRFWLDDYLKADPRTRAEVQQMYHDMRVIDAADIQHAEGLPPKRIADPAPIRPAVPNTQISAIPEGAR